jgi:hypothetical protein
MSDNSLAPRQNSELVKSSESLAKRGLEVIEELQQKDVVLSELEILPFMERFRIIKSRIGDIPEEFLNRTTANPNDITAFGINDFLLAFDKIRIRQNFVLDYVYYYDGHSGQPLVYAREKDSHPIESPDEYYKRFSKPRPEMLLGNEPNPEDYVPYLSPLEFENTPIGYFEFSMFCMTVRRFYLFWHSNYNDIKYILTKSGLNYFAQNRIGGISPKEIELLLSTNYSPKVSIFAKSGRVSVLTFEVNTGYSFLNISIRHPNIFQGAKDEVIIKNHTTRFF